MAEQGHYCRDLRWVFWLVSRENTHIKRKAPKRRWLPGRMTKGLAGFPHIVQWVLRQVLIKHYPNLILYSQVGFVNSHSGYYSLCKPRTPPWESWYHAGSVLVVLRSEIPYFLTNASWDSLNQEDEVTVSIREHSELTAATSPGNLLEMPIFSSLYCKVASWGPVVRSLEGADTCPGLNCLYWVSMPTVSYIVT